MDYRTRPTKIIAVHVKVDVLGKITKKLDAFSKAGVPKSSVEFWFNSYPGAQVVKFLREHGVGYKVWYSVF